MKRFLYNLFLFFLFSLFFALIFKIRIYPPPPSPLANIDLKSLDACQNRDKAECVLSTIAANNSRIKSFSSDISISLKRLSATGNLYYDNGKLRFLAYSLFGKEIDIGSNNNFFWFWSRRIRPQALYYSSNNSQCYNNLKPVFNEEWISDCFIFNNLRWSHEDEFFDLGNFLLVKHKLNRVKNYVLTVVDCEEFKVLSKCLYDMDDILIASVSYEHFDKNQIPTVVNMIWYEEDLFMRWDIKNSLINLEINKSMWDFPKYEPKIDICTEPQ